MVRTELITIAKRGLPALVVDAKYHLPPVHPVFTSQAVVPCCAIFSASIDAYFMGCHMRKAPPKQALKVASGSVTPCSVPATYDMDTILFRPLQVPQTNLQGRYNYFEKM